MTLYGGLFVNLSSIGPWLYWLQFVSFFKWAYEGLLINEYTGMTLFCEPDEYSGVAPYLVCPITTGEQELTKLGLIFPTVWQSAVILLGFGVLFRFSGLLMLQYQTRRAIQKNQ